MTSLLRIEPHHADVAELRALVDPPRDGWLAYMARHGRSFRFAARCLDAADRDRIAAVYAFCRFTDDLVDVGDADDARRTEARLDAWLSLLRLEHAGGVSGVPLLERVVGDLRRHDVPLRHAEELIEGVRMDLRRVRYPTLDALRVYTFRVASTVGLWLSELFGVRGAFALSRAARLGHAMQLTNILRDVGDDLWHGRVYLPADLMAVHGVSSFHLSAWGLGGVPHDDGWRALAESLMAEAEAAYDDAREALPVLPPGFRRATAVAARVYLGIHDEIRRADYDVFGRRAWVRPRRKLTLAARALLDLGPRGAFSAAARR
ncbi:Squalene/phytoene synthase [Gemmatirosa kalamazoonensis]|uniref:Squalene/phytoene synthase n=1 Tax=Gemmatirosa kalamazoonensis TaxID=861299 RepID=W0RG12_9BACT|nr:phytoene/squalene synthase family protein [Gemmatirosa kalamazoonensis]AHG89377.1 Squalene/phytoene synthase [Gemmatirosa kalamazoonensis]